jgi:hypothetical protein
MTHGCIVVERTDEKRKILLHTYHSGYLIPDIVKFAPAFVCKHRWSFLIRHHADYPTEEALKEGLLNNFDDGMYYQPSVAALLVACRPWVLEVVPNSFRADLASWAGDDSPYRLVMDEAKCNWTVFDQEKEQILSMNPTGAMFDWLWAKIEDKNKRKPSKRSGLKSHNSKTSATGKAGA